MGTTKVIEQQKSSFSLGHRIVSGSEIAKMEIPEITYYIEGMLRVGGKATLIAKKKMGKSFFAIDLGMHISEGRDFLGFKTTPCNVLYVNFEISEEKLMQRIQDIQGVRGIEAPNFRTVSPAGGMKLDRANKELINLLETCNEGKFPIQTLILDPRIKCMERDENESAVINAFTRNLDSTINQHKGLGIFIVHHAGKATTGAGRGHSSYDGWLDTIINIEAPGQAQTDSGEILPSLQRILTIEGRDIESHTFGVEFNYPVYNLDPSVLEARASKVQKAKEFILNRLRETDSILQFELRRSAIGGGYSDYSFNRALSELRDTGDVRESKAQGQGYRKLLTARK